MKRVGKIDRTIYTCVTEDIITDKVVLTDNQIEHVIEGHGDDYKTIKKYLKTVIEQPDYIIEDTKPNTAIVLKGINDIRILLVLRLATSKEINYENSIITFFKIDEKRWNRYLRNRKILYKV